MQVLFRIEIDHSVDLTTGCAFKSSVVFELERILSLVLTRKGPVEKRPVFRLQSSRSPRLWQFYSLHYVGNTAQRTAPIDWSLFQVVTQFSASILWRRLAAGHGGQHAGSRQRLSRVIIDAN